MITTIYRIAASGIFLLVILFNTPLGPVKTGYAQSDTNWSPPLNLSKSGASVDPSIVVDSEGVIHVIWFDAVDGYKYAYSTDGINWSKPKTVDFPFTLEDSRPKLFADASGSIHMFWTRPDNEFDEDKLNEFYYARASSIFLSQPLSWAAVTVLDDGVLDYDVFADTHSVIHLSYARSTSTESNPAGIFYRRLDNRAWSPALRLYSSQYFRTLPLEDSHVRLAVAGGGRSGEVYAVWDDRSSKRVYLAKSLDGGVKWQEAVQLRGPEDVTGLALPYNVNVSATGKNVLLTWQLGEPGSLCSQYSQWSTDGAQTLTDPVRISDEPNTCPTSGMFVGRPTGYFLMLLDIFGDLSLTAWNGLNWSSLQPQGEMNAFSNPLTLDDVVLGCRQVTHHNDMLYMVGCDQSGTDDIWFRSRKIGPLEDWFPPPSTWAGPAEISGVTQEIASGVSVTGNNGVLHQMWIQYSSGINGTTASTVQYAKWEAGEWSRPTSIITGLKGIPQNMTAISDAQGGLLVAWVEGVNGEIYFSRSLGDKAYLASEWSPVLRIPSLSELNTAPDMLTDSTNRIAMVYSIPFNENRGIYFVYSDDLGRNWSQPARVFDAVTMGWDSVTEPRLELSEGGRIHLLITRNSLGDGSQESSLYYLHSADGGVTWTSPEVVSERNVQWSEIVYAGNNVLYRLWQEQYDGGVESFSEVSADGGLTWSSALKVSISEKDQAALTLIKDANGQLYLMQAYPIESGLVMEEFKWDGSHWISQAARTVHLSQPLDRFFISSGITSDRVLHLIATVDFEGDTESVENDILGYSRMLEPLENPPSPATLILPAPAGSVSSVTTIVPEVNITPTRISPLENLQEDSNARMRNLIGLGLVVGIVILTLIFLWPASRRKKSS
jgi:hypothetical protein